MITFAAGHFARIAIMQEAISSGQGYGITLWADGVGWGGSSFGLAPINGDETPDALSLKALIDQNPAISTIGWYKVAYAHSHLCVDDTGYNRSNGTPLIQWTCGVNQTNQEWRVAPAGGCYSVISSRNASLVWDITGGEGATNSQALAELWRYWGGKNQQWTPVSLGNGSYNFVARHSGLCLDVPSASALTGTQLQQYTCNQTGVQAFTLSQQP